MTLPTELCALVGKAGKVFDKTFEKDTKQESVCTVHLIIKDFIQVYRLSWDKRTQCLTTRWSGQVLGGG